MSRFFRLLALGLLLGLGAALLVWWREVGTRTYFCEAARTPAAYRGEWFYRLHAGPDGWLLRDDDLTTVFKLDETTLSYLTRLNRALEAEGVSLVLAAQPPRGVALSAGSIAGYDPGATLRSYEEARAALQQTGLHVTNLATVVQDTPKYFFKRDHHWTPEGAERSAEAVAEVIKSTAATVTSPPQTFRTEAVGREEQVGSFGEAIGRICGENPPAERLTRYRTQASRTGAETSPEDSLFGETPAPPIALVGTSNSAREDLNFAGFLEQETGLTVLNASAVGGGPQAALESYLRSPTFREAEPRFIVWEFATLFDLPEDPIFYRQLIPSVRGACSAAASSAAVTKALAGTRMTLFEGVPETRAAYLYLEFSDLSLTAFDLGIRYRDGRSETVEVRRSSRETNDGHFFLEFQGPVERVTLTVSEDATGTVQARLCP
jgi:alginate biosynthesis protein AlgX